VHHRAGLRPAVPAGHPQRVDDELGGCVDDRPTHNPPEMDGTSKDTPRTDVTGWSRRGRTRHRKRIDQRAAFQNLVDDVARRRLNVL